MANPFLQRASEYLNEKAFLARVSPIALHTHFCKHAEEEKLYDRLTVIVGTPGSGKTTTARLFLLPTVSTLLNTDLPNYKEITYALKKCRAIGNDAPNLMGCRLSLESEYREFWELPYDESLKTELLHRMIQARAMLGWIRDLRQEVSNDSEIKFRFKGVGKAALDSIGGESVEDLFVQARKVEKQLYNIVAALVPPSIKDLANTMNSPYRPFDLIDKVNMQSKSKESICLTPLIILDDVHILHEIQFNELVSWLSRRELKFGRWIMTRMDAIDPENIIDKSFQGSKKSRDITTIWLQQGGPKRQKNFRRLSEDMATKYIKQMSIFINEGIDSVSRFLDKTPKPLPAGKISKLKKKIDNIQRKYNISLVRRAEFEAKVSSYHKGSRNKTISEAISLGMVSILMERFVRRIPQASLFSEEKVSDRISKMKVDSRLSQGAKIQLLHEYNYPHYYGFESVCNASSENVEQFLHLVSILVSHAETQLIRGKSSSLTCELQNKLLREQAQTMIDENSFPYRESVYRLANKIAEICKNKSLEPNAPLGGGASAIGVPQNEIDSLDSKSDLARVLKYGIANNIISIRKNYQHDHAAWCLIELNGVFLIKYGLTLQKGGFVEKTVRDMFQLIKG